MIIGVFGCSHHVAPVEFREKLSWPEAELATVLHAFLSLPGMEEAAIVSTCNRTEIYFACHYSNVNPEPIIHWLAEEKDMSVDSIREHCYLYTGSAAARHLFRVTAGMDSMIIGETQITNQVKQAYRLAQSEQTLGKHLYALFDRSFALTKKIHTETGISKNAVSVSYAAVELAKKIFGSLKNKRALLVGAGEVAQLVAQHLADGGIGTILIANRSELRANELAAGYNGRPIQMETLPDQFVNTDIVISSTSAQQYVIQPEWVTRAMRQRKGKPLFFVDLAVPRDIDPAIGGIEGVFLYDIDDLKMVVDANLEERLKEARKAESIIDRGVSEYMDKLLELEAVPLIRSLREKAEAIRQEELNQALRRLADLDDDQKAVIESMSRLIVNKLLNDPMRQVKEMATEQHAELHLQAFSRLFALETDRKSWEKQHPQNADNMAGVSSLAYTENRE